MPVDDPSVAHIVEFHVKGFAKLRAAWPGHYQTLRAADRPGAFAVFAGYEIHSGAHGDYTIVLADLEDGPLELADDPAALKAALRARYGDRAFAFPHHIGYRTGARGINWETFDAELSPFVEMFSMHGCAEASETERAPTCTRWGRWTGIPPWRRGLPGGMSSASSAIPTTIAVFRAPMGMAAWRSMRPAAHDRDAFWNRHAGAPQPMR